MKTLLPANYANLQCYCYLALNAKGAFDKIHHHQRKERHRADPTDIPELYRLQRWRRLTWFWLEINAVSSGLPHMRISQSSNLCTTGRASEAPSFPWGCLPWRPGRVLWGKAGSSLQPWEATCIRLVNWLRQCWNLFHVFRAKCKRS